MTSKPPLRVSLLFKVALAAIASVALLAAILVYSYGQQMGRTADESLDKRAEAIVMSLASECEYGLSVGNRTLLQQATFQALEHGDVVAAVVFDGQGRVMANAGQVDVETMRRAGPALVQQHRRGGIEEAETQGGRATCDQFFAPVFLQAVPVDAELGTDELAAVAAKPARQRIGLVRLSVSIVSTRQAVQKARQVAFGLTAVTALLVSMICVLAVRRAVRPLLTLAAGTEKLAAGDLAVRVQVSSSDEIGSLAASFNKMAGSLQQSHAEILSHQRHLEQRVRERTSELEKEIAERERAEEALRKAVAFSEGVVNSSPGVFCVFDAAGKFLRWNRNLELVTGYAAAEIAGRNALDFFASEDRARAERTVRQVFAEGAANVEVELLAKNGTRIPYYLTGVKLVLGDRPCMIGAGMDITDRKRAQAELEQLHRRLVENSHQAGMAEVATSVLHNVGNVLNSVNVSSSVVAERLGNSKVANLARLVNLIQEHKADLGVFLTGDPKGQQVPDYLASLAAHLAQEQRETIAELQSLNANIEHIKEIVAMQQSYASVAGLRERLPLAGLVEDALRLNAAALARHQVQIVREYAAAPPVEVEKHKVLQILVNMIRNAKYAVEESGRTDKRVTVRVGPAAGGLIKVSISDNGVGIPRQNLTRIFEHGFTTRSHGHGFGLHSSALAAKELGGKLTAHSAGPGQGAVFTLELPCPGAAASEPPARPHQEQPPPHRGPS